MAGHTYTEKPGGVLVHVATHWQEEGGLVNVNMSPHIGVHVFCACHADDDSCPAIPRYSTACPCSPADRPWCGLSFDKTEDWQ